MVVSVAAEAQLQAYVDELEEFIELETAHAISLGMLAEDWDGVAWPGRSGPDGLPDAPGVRPGACWEAGADEHAMLRQMVGRWGHWPAALAALPREHAIMGAQWHLAITETLLADLTDEEVGMAVGAHRNTIARHRQCGLAAMVRWLVSRW